MRRAFVFFTVVSLAFVATPNVFAAQLTDDAVLNVVRELRAHLHEGTPSFGPVGWRATELERIVREHDHDTRWLATMVDDAHLVMHALDHGHDPFATPHGYMRMGFLSKLDHTFQTYELFTPPAYRQNQAKKWPLVVTLHGLEGNGGDFFRNTFGLSRPPSMSLLDHARHGDAPTRGPMFVIAPTARGQTHYRFAGEEDVFEAIADATARFHIDPARVYVTGGSMGGTGAAFLPLHHPGFFAGSMALAGYHDQRVRNDTAQDQLAPWEQFLRADRSDVDWAENALHLPMFLGRGTRDLPMQWTHSLVARLEALHYNVTHREPVSGHNIWTELYADGAVFTHFAPMHAEQNPDRVVYTTSSERYDRAYWLSDIHRDAPDVFARVEGSRNDAIFTIRTQHVASFSIDALPGVAATRNLLIRVDGDSFTGPATMSFIKKQDGHWEQGTPSVEQKKHGFSGPIRDIYHEPLLFVIGTSDGAEEVNRRVADFWANPRGWEMHYPVVRDSELTPALCANHSLVLVGTRASNAALARFMDRLPIRADADGIELGTQRFVSRDLGAVFIAPDPDHASRTLLVVTGSSSAAVERSTALPELLPDYMIFDANIEPARRHFAAGGTGATYLAAGFFDMAWHVISP